jgi:ribonuclease HI
LIVFSNQPSSNEQGTIRQEQGQNPLGNQADWPAIELYTDGACSGNPGPGGWAFVLRDVATGREKEGSGGQAGTTNNQMELMAVIRGLEALRRPCRVLLCSDSKYVGQGMTEWMAGWKSRGWQRREGKQLKPVKNVELWQQLDALMQRHVITFKHVKGHSGHAENERCDELAVAAARKVT